MTPEVKKLGSELEQQNKSLKPILAGAGRGFALKASDVGGGNLLKDKKLRYDSDPYEPEKDGKAIKYFSR